MESRGEDLRWLEFEAAWDSRSVIAKTRWMKRISGERLSSEG